MGSLSLKIDSGFLKISLGPTNPFMALLIQFKAASVVIAAEAPLESESYFPALMALKGMKWATHIPMACSIYSAVAPIKAPYTHTEAIAP